MRIIAVVQARMGSSRLPNKVMAMIQGRPMVWHVVDRLRHAVTHDDVVLSIPDNTSNDTLHNLADVEHIPHFAGAEHDLLDRTLKTAMAFGADAIVRITADCPLIDPQVADRVIRLFRGGGLDYASNVWPRRTYPAGIAIEVYDVGLLDYLDRHIDEPDYREYFMAYLWERSGQFRTANAEYPGPDLSRLRWTVDYKEDLEFVKRVYGALYDPGSVFVMEDILALLWKRPDIAAINAGMAVEPFHGLRRRA